MKKADLVEALVDVVGKRSVAEQAVACVLSSVTDALKNGEAVTLVGFGTFKVAKREARNGRNPQTGKTIKIKAKNVPRFTAGKMLKEAVAGTKLKAKGK
jgi:DNA-binding protein HU-beta